MFSLLAVNFEHRAEFPISHCYRKKSVSASSEKSVSLNVRGPGSNPQPLPTIELRKSDAKANTNSIPHCFCDPR
jgi:hypothetical protein